ncbi:unnamed protein product [Ectocarpus sp. CCAP 1310/34]|nr:unnamed protein product [Ectocarpus sp. CCAP 1310/34]
MHQSAALIRRIPHLRLGQPRHWLGTRVRFTEGGGCSVDDGDDDDGCTAPPGLGQVAVKLLAAPCTLADLRTTAARQPPPPSPNRHHGSSSGLEFPRTIGGTEALWEITAVGGDVSSLRPGDLAVPVMAGNDSGNGARQAAGTWRSRAILTEASLVKVPIVGGSGAAAAGVLGEESSDGGGVGVEVAAHCSGSVATAIRILDDFVEKELGAGDRVVFTGASSAVAQARCCEEEAALALKLGAWKATLLKEFKAMRMDNACIVADGEGGVLGFTAARALRFRGCFVSYADLSGGGVSLPVAGQIFSDTKCRGFSLRRWASARPPSEKRDLVERSLGVAASAGLRLEGARDFPLREAALAIDAVRQTGCPVLLRGPP